MNHGITNYDNYKTIIFHIDVNSAFLSWSAVKKLRDEPGSIDLRTVPSAVGGDIKSRHGIITAKSIPAKKYGIVTHAIYDFLVFKEIREMFEFISIL